MGWLLGNFKFILAFVAAAAIAFVVWQYTTLVSERATLKVQNDQLKKNEQVYQQAIADKDLVIELLKYVDDLKEEAIAERDMEIEKIETQYEDIVNNSLGEDIDDQAAESLKELIRKLKGIQ